MKTSFTRSLYILLTLLLAACGPLAPMPTPTIQSNEAPTPAAPISTVAAAVGECIQPYTELAYPSGAGEMAEPSKTEIFPLGWEFISDVPLLVDGYVFDFVASNDNFFVSYRQSGQNVLARYDLHKETWGFYPTTKERQVNPQRLFILSTGEVWNYYDFTPVKPSLNSYPLLSRYDITTDKFEPIIDKQGILKLPRTILNIIEGKNGLIWILIKEDPNSLPSLFSFDPNSLDMEKHDIHVTYTVFPRSDGKLWVPDWENHRLALYNPASHKIQYFDSINTFTQGNGDNAKIPFSHLIGENVAPSYLDRSNRLWFGYSGWLDISDTNDIDWYNIITPPELVSYADIIKPMYMISPLALRNIFQSSNGWMWFTTIDGIVRLKIQDNFQHGEWCKITNGHSKVTEDQQGNLWIIVFNKIYKYHIQSE